MIVKAHGKNFKLVDELPNIGESKGIVEVRTVTEIEILFSNSSYDFYKIYYDVANEEYADIEERYWTDSELVCMRREI